MKQIKLLSSRTGKIWGSGVFGVLLCSYVILVPFTSLPIVVCIIPIALLDILAANSFSWKIHNWTWQERIGDIFSIVAVAVLGFLRVKVGSPQSSILSVPVQCFFSILIIDTCGYWIHYLAHYSKFLWKLHRVHHSRQSPNIWNASYEHLGDTLFRLIIPGLLLVFLGFDKSVIEMVSCLTALFGAFSHINIKVKIPYPLVSLMINPITHRLHHHKNEIAINNGSITHLWDHFMKTYSLYEMKPDEYGLKPDQQISDSPTHILITHN